MYFNVLYCTYFSYFFSFCFLDQFPMVSLILFKFSKFFQWLTTTVFSHYIYSMNMPSLSLSFIPLKSSQATWSPSDTNSDIFCLGSFPQPQQLCIVYFSHQIDTWIGLYFITMNAQGRPGPGPGIN